MNFWNFEEFRFPIGAVHFSLLQSAGFRGLGASNAFSPQGQNGRGVKLTTLVWRIRMGIGAIPSLCGKRQLAFIPTNFREHRIQEL
jgi:hypothetical protein